MKSLRPTLIATITRRYPFYSGCGTLANSKLIEIFSGKLTGDSWCDIDGGEILVDLNEYIGKAAFFVGDLDRKISWVCKQIVNKGDVVLDIGANIGMVTILLSDLVGADGKVHSFEPNPMLISKLTKSIDRNNIKNVSLHQIALGSDVGELELVTPRHNQGLGSLVLHKNKTNCDHVMVKVDTLNNITKSEKIKSVRLVKIDVEGFEYQVFCGAQTFLSDTQPDTILFELNEYNENNFYKQPLVLLLLNNDYELFAIPKNLFRMNLVKVTPAYLKNMSSHDFLAIKKGDNYNELVSLVKANK